MQKLIKENAKQLGMVKELKQANDQLRGNERRLRDEIVSLNDKLRATKAEALRKENMARELREKLELTLEENADFSVKQAEIDRLKDQLKKLKLECEIKDNQVRTLKVKVEHCEGENEQLKRSQREEVVEQQMEQQLKQAKSKVKKTENLARKTLEALRKLGKEVLAAYQAYLTGASRKSTLTQQAKPIQNRI